MPGSRSRLRVALCCLGVLALSVTACSKKDNTSNSSTSSTVATPGTTAKPAKGNPCGEWPNAAKGAPTAMKDAAVNGYFVWQDVTGWHLRARGSGKEAFKGAVTGNLNMDKVIAVPDGAGVKADLKDNKVTFEIPANGGDPKGFDLVAGCKTSQLQFALLLGDQAAPVESIYVGANGKAVAALFAESKT